jgi:hypothetical protein
MANIRLIGAGGLGLVVGLYLDRLKRSILGPNEKVPQHFAKAKHLNNPNFFIAFDKSPINKNKKALKAVSLEPSGWAVPRLVEAEHSWTK